MRCVIFLACLLATVAPVAGQTGGSGATATGISRDFNPAISVNGLFLGAGFPGLPDSSAAAWGRESGLRLQEAELQFTAAIDPYAKADVVFSFEDGAFDIEEAIVSSTVLSHGLGLRAGRMFVPIGYENTLHTHQLPFIERSLVGSAVLGEGLGEFGLEVAYVPALPFFVEAHGAVYNGDDEALFDAPGSWDLAYAGGLDALWEVSEGGTVSFGADYCGGPNVSGTVDAAAWTHLAAGVLRYKWRSPTRARERAAELVLEYLYGEQAATESLALRQQEGLYGDAKLQFARRWWVQGRYDYLPAAAVGGVDVEGDATQRGSLLLAFVPSEFSALRLQGSVVDAPTETYGEVFLQFNFTIGSHPAHRY